MKSRAHLLLCLLALTGCGRLAALRPGGAARSASWIRPAWPASAPPACTPVALHWYVEQRCPLLYSRAIEIPRGAHSASALLRSSAHVYVYLDGRQVYAWPAAGTPVQKSPAPSATRVHAVDLGRALRPGRHLLTVSAAADGFALDGAYYDRAGARVGPLKTDGRWSVAQHAATTVMEEGGALDPPVAVGAVAAAAEWQADATALADVEYEFRLAHLHGAAAESAWRIDLLRKRGIYEVDGTAHGGLGFRVEPKALAETAAQASRLAAGDDPVAVAAELRRIARRAHLADERKALRLIAAEAGVDGESASHMRVAALRRRLEARLRHPINELNRSRFDRLGWAPITGALDNDPSRWGIEFAAPRGPARVRGPDGWRFAPDPQDAGIAERRWAPDYNIDDQWAELAVAAQRGWRSDPRFAAYTGPGWYRGRVSLPRAWSGRHVVFAVRIAGRARLWWDGREIDAVRGARGWRRYELVLPRDAAGAHLVALRVAAPAGGAAGLLQRGVFVRAEADVAVDGAVEIEVLPLSPAVRIEAPLGAIRLEHEGRLSVGTWDGAAVAWSDGYVRARDGRLRVNWVLLRAGAAAPIQLIFARNPERIVAADGVTRLELAREGEHVVAVRPFGDRAPRTWSGAAFESAVTLWSRAARALPTDYVSVTRVLEKGEPWRDATIDRMPRGPLLGQTVVYDYALDVDEWGTEPLRLAALPPLASYAVDHGFPELAVDAVRTLQPGGSLAPYRGIAGADRVRYRYRVEPYPRQAGFTSWMFAHGDAGVPGNVREMALLAATGANSFRAQHNWADEAPKRRSAPDDRRTRLQVLLDACRAAGLTYVNNIDQTLGARREEVRADYGRWRRRLAEHYAKLLAVLAPQPFAGVAYDLINEPFDHARDAYNATIAELTGLIRRRDRSHLLYVEPPESWGGVEQIGLVRTTGDPLTLYSFHDYAFRLARAGDRWPTVQEDLASIYRRWLPALLYQAEHGVGLHCGEFGNFAAATHASGAQRTLLNDLFQVLDQFAMHHHYYSGREIYLTQADGSLLPSEIVRAYREYFRDGGFNGYYD